MFNSKLLTFEINLDRTGSGCIRFNDLNVENATFAEYFCPIRLRGGPGVIRIRK